MSDASVMSIISSNASEPPRKRIRKGRRRKKSCTTNPQTPGICLECSARNVPCVTQEISLGSKQQRPRDSREDLQQRVTQLESALVTIAQKLHDPPNGSNVEHSAVRTAQETRLEILPPSPAYTPSASSPDTRADNAPVLSLFDNAILSRLPERGFPSDTGGTSFLGLEPGETSTSKLAQIHRTLSSVFPSPPILQLILDNAQLWWANMQEIFPQILGAGSSTDMAQYIKDLRSSRSVQKLAKALMCISVVLQEVEIALDSVTGSSTTSQSLITQYLNVVDELVLSDDALAGTIDGVECMFLQSKHDSNQGRVRRAWLTLRRGQSFAQILGLHRYANSSAITSDDDLRKQSLWRALYNGDRFFSLLLGLPYGAPTAAHDLSNNQALMTKPNAPMEPRDYFYHLAHIVGHIIERNEEPATSNTLPLTLKIEGELMDLAASMPQDWWSLDVGQGDLVNQMYSHLLPQFWHQEARTLLHLPFMLKAATDRRYEYNRIAALDSARALIKLYQIIRPLKGFGSLVCKITDFQAFSSAMVLVLNMFDRGRTATFAEDQEAKDDQIIVNTTTQILRNASRETNGIVATQAARALEMFSDIRSMMAPQAQCVSKVVVPYFGTVVFGPSHDFVSQARAQSDKVQQPLQIPTPTDSLDLGTNSSAGGSETLGAEYNGIPFQASPDSDFSGNSFADVNFDLDQDWSWFWNNTDLSFVNTDMSQS